MYPDTYQKIPTVAFGELVRIKSGFYRGFYGVVVDCVYKEDLVTPSQFEIKFLSRDLHHLNPYRISVFAVKKVSVFHKIMQNIRSMRD